jgi:hypothetical protein
LQPLCRHVLTLHNDLAILVEDHKVGPAQGTQDTCGKKFPPISCDLTGLVPHA